MADNKNTPSVHINAPAKAEALTTPAPSAQFTQEQLTQALMMIAQSMQGQQAFNEFAKRNTPKPRKTLEQYLKEKPRKRLHRETFQNNSPINPRGLSQPTLDLLDTLATGTYAPGDGGVTIQVVRIGRGKESHINLFYSTKSLEQRMAVYMRWRTLTAMIQAVADEMVARNIPFVNEERPEPVEPEIVDTNPE